MKRTPLFAAHQRSGAKLIEFGGWEMPVFYTSIADEHLAVRNAAGLFDISHMGEVIVEGSGALKFVNHILANDASRLNPGQGQYSFLCNPAGGVIDDLYVYRLEPEKFLLIINASRIDADVAWMTSQHAAGPWDTVALLNESAAFGAVALQGPSAAAVMDLCCQHASSGGTAVPGPTALKKNEVGEFECWGKKAFVARTGYTGEDGFEIVAPAERMESIWNDLLAKGAPLGLKPAGLGARDTLRTEVCYPLYGHELDEQTSPIEAGLGFFVSLDKGPFIGRDALVQQKATGVRRKLVAFRATGRCAPPRQHYPIWVAGQKLGTVTSGTQSPSLNAGIGLGYLPSEYAKPQTEIEIEIRGQRFPALTVPKPIYKKPS